MSFQFQLLHFHLYILFHSILKLLYYNNNKPALPMLSSFSVISLNILSKVNLYVVLIIEVSEVFVSEILFSETPPLTPGCHLAWLAYLHVLWFLKIFLEVANFTLIFTWGTIWVWNWNHMSLEIIFFCCSQKLLNMIMSLHFKFSIWSLDM